MSGKDFHLHNSFVFWLNRLAATMRDSFNEALKDEDISWPQWQILNLLYHEAADTPALLADGMGVDRSAVTRLLDRLAAKQMLERHHDDGDRRSIRITLTTVGKARIGSLNQAALEHQQRFLSELPATELRGLKGNLQKLLRVGEVETLTLWRQV